MKYLMLLFFISLCMGQEILLLDYRKVYDLALRNNRELQKLREQLTAFNVDYQLAQRYYFPIVYAGASLLYDLDKNRAKSEFSISIISTLYEFQKTKSRIATLGIKRDIGQIMIEQLNKDIQLRIIKLFVEANLYKKLTEVKREEMAIAYVRFDRTREKRELGFATEHEVLKAETVYREKRSELTYAQYMYNHTLLEIKKLAGIPYETIIEIEDLPFEEAEGLLEDFSKLKEEALKKNTTLKIKSLELDSYEEEIKIARGVISPKVNLRMTTNRMGLEANTPIYDAGRKYKMEYVSAIKRAIQKEKEDLELNISLIFSSAPYEWEYLKSKWLEALVKNKFAEENLKLKRFQYEVELAFDLGYAMAEKSEAERQLMEARYKLILFWAKLFNLAGKDPFLVLK